MINNNYDNNNSIDIVKLIMAIFVIAIHTMPLYNINNEYIKIITESIFRIAVPFFFITSGYLIGNRLKSKNKKEKLEYIKNSISKNIKLYLLWSIIYLPINLIEYFTNNESIVFNILHYIRGLFFIGEHYNSWMLWFLLSIIYTLILFYIIIKLDLSKNSICFLYIIAFFLHFILDYISINGSDIGILDKIIKFTINGGRLFQGFYMFISGIFISKNYNKLVNRKGLVLRFVTFFVLFAYVNVKNIEILKYLLYIILAIYLLLISLTWNFGNEHNKLRYRKLSTGLYFSHLFVWTVYYAIVYGRKTYGFDSFVCTLIVSSIITYIYYKGVKNE